MSTPFIGQIMIVGFNFAPVNWAMCDGQLMAISQNTALFSILGTTYGGNGTSTFALPNLQNATPLHFGQGPGLSQYDLGEVGGTESVTLLTSNVPAHTHALTADGSVSAFGAPSATEVFGASKSARPGVINVYGPPTNPANMGPSSITPFVGSQLPHNNRQPFLGLTFVIALFGIFPSRN